MSLQSWMNLEKNSTFPPDADPAGHERRCRLFERLVSRFKLTYYKADLGNDYDPDTPHERERTEIENANVVSSWLDPNHETTADPWGGAGDLVDLHVLMFDCDHPVFVRETSPGRFHVVIDVPMPWRSVKDCLDALAAAGVVEPGYVSASEARGACHLRLPWVKK